MKNKAVIATIAVVLIVGIGVFFLMTKDKGDTGKTSNTSTTTTATDSPEEKKDVRQAVWEQLTPEQQEKIDWTTATVSKIVAKTGVGSGIRLDDPSYEGKDVYMIDYTMDIKAIPNNMFVLADTTTYEIVGYGIAD